MCGTTCFGRLPGNHQEHTTPLGASGFTVVGWRLECYGRGLADRKQKRSSRFSPTVKLKASSAVVCS